VVLRFPAEVRNLTEPAVREASRRAGRRAGNGAFFGLTNARFISILHAAGFQFSDGANVGSVHKQPVVSDRQNVGSVRVDQWAETIRGEDYAGMEQQLNVH
jgi:hypothetical protein